jgi:hypothetical protein
MEENRASASSRGETFGVVLMTRAERSFLDVRRGVGEMWGLAGMDTRPVNWKRIKHRRRLRGRGLLAQLVDDVVEGDVAVDVIGGVESEQGVGNEGTNGDDSPAFLGRDVRER